jgi:chromosome segregation protein
VYLKGIDIYGFKTFADKTSLIFKPGVTAIVGPNGCGKSNIVDAIRWVLGETNARSLRGEVMEDVIFSGSEERKPLGMAEVSITIVNDDNLLPIEYSEVTVKRRLYRSGESEFFINKNSVRLKEIIELFADTGIGKTAYSIMEQGNIDILLSNKPEERMLIFEEAAGITKYKMRIKESYRKLAATDENLLRLNLIINEVEKEYRNLEKQAEKAQVYRELKKEEVHNETLYNYERVRSIKKQVSGCDERLTELKNLKSKCEGEIVRLNDVIKKDMEMVRHLEGQIMDMKSEMYKKEAELETIESKLSHTHERIKEIENEILKRQTLIEDSRRRKEELDGKVNQLNKDRGQMHELLISQEEKLEGYLKEIHHIEELIEEENKKVLEDTEKVDQVVRDVQSLREDLKVVIDRLLQEIDAIKSTHVKSDKRKNELIEMISSIIQKLDMGLKHHTTKLQDLVYVSRTSDFKDSVRKLTEGVREIREGVDKLRSCIDEVLEIQDELSRVIFGKESLHTRKEQIEKAIANLLRTEGRLRDEIGSLNDEIKRNRVKKENFEEIVGSIRTDIARNREKKEHYEENLRMLALELERSEDALNDIDFELNALQRRRADFLSIVDELKDQIKSVEEEKKNLGERIREQNSLIEAILNQIRENELQLENQRRGIANVTGEVESLELKRAELLSRIETICETFRERYGRSLELFQPDGEVDIKTINDKREEIKRKLEELGQVNLIAIEEFQEVRKRYDYLLEQKADLQRAKDDLNQIVSHTLKSSKDIFMESFEKIRQNFNNIFRRLFNGGKTDLYLTNEADIFNTGVEIIACPPGKSLKKRSLLSGGEKSLTAIALLFAIFMVKPSPFCILDEVDHDLDEENVVRFLKLLKEFTDTTQFIIITHNRRTIEFSDVLYGVTSEHAGVSKVVSIEMVEDAIK